MEPFNSSLSYEIVQDYSTTATHIQIIIHFLIYKGFIYSLLTTVWYHTYGCTKQYFCASDIYLLSLLLSYFV